MRLSNIAFMHNNDNGECGIVRGFDHVSTLFTIQFSVGQKT